MSEASAHHGRMQDMHGASFVGSVVLKLEELHRRRENGASLLCLVGKHKPIRVIDEISPIAREVAAIYNVPPFFVATRAHYECRECNTCTPMTTMSTTTSLRSSISRMTKRFSSRLLSETKRVTSSAAHGSMNGMGQSLSYIPTKVPMEMLLKFYSGRSMETGASGNTHAEVD